MKLFENVAAQGDLYLHRVDALPEGLEQVSAENGEYILAHSETGHHHVVAERPDVRLYQDPNDPLVAYLEFLSAEVQINHKRSFDTHESIASSKPGIFRITRQREHTAEGFRRAQD